MGLPASGDERKVMSRKEKFMGQSRNRCQIRETATDIIPYIYYITLPFCDGIYFIVLTHLTEKNHDFYTEFLNYLSSFLSSLERNLLIVPTVLIACSHILVCASFASPVFFFFAFSFGRSSSLEDPEDGINSLPNL